MLVTYRKQGAPSSSKWWTSTDEVRGLRNADDVHDRLALPKDWTGGALRERVVVRIPKGTDVSYVHGRAAPQPGALDPRAGGGEQFRFMDFDERWVVERTSRVP